MDDFGTFCYLDVQKTGSTYVGQFLRECSRIPVLMSDKHATISGNGVGNLFGLIRKPGCYSRDTFYFNSVRNPFKYYASLYNYGCDGRGGLYSRFQKVKRDDLYDGTREGFYGWLDHLLALDPAAPRLPGGYEEVGTNGIGLLSYLRRRRRS